MFQPLILIMLVSTSSPCRYWHVKHKGGQFAVQPICDSMLGLSVGL